VSPSEGSMEANVVLPLSPPPRIIRAKLVMPELSGSSKLASADSRPLAFIGKGDGTFRAWQNGPVIPRVESSLFSNLLDVDAPKLLARFFAAGPGTVNCCRLPGMGIHLTLR
jgi:hypothetical protein